MSGTAAHTPDTAATPTDDFGHGQLSWLPPAENIEAAAMLVADASARRSLAHPLKARAMPWYRRWIDRRWATFVHTAAVLQVCLAIFEGPVRPIFADSISAWLDVLGCCVVLADWGIYWCAMDRSGSASKIHRHSKWRLPVLAAGVGLLVSALCDIALGGSGYRLRLVRPLFLIERYEGLRNVVGNVLASTLRVVRVAMLMVLHILIMGFVFYLALADIEADQAVKTGPDTPVYFQSLLQTLGTLSVLSTTANFPDCALLVIEAQPVSALLFIMFGLIGVIFLNNLVLADITMVYADLAKNEIARVQRRNNRAMAKAFELLTPPPDAQDQHGVSLPVWRALLRQLRPRLPQDKVDALFHYVDSFDEDRSEDLDAQELRHAVLFVGAQIRVHKQQVSFQGNVATFSAQAVHHMGRRAWRAVQQAAQWVLRLSIHGWLVLDTAANIMVIANVVFMLLQMAEEDAHTMTPAKDRVYEGLQSMCLVFFVAELVTKLCGLGLRKYWAAGIMNRLDAILIISSLAAEVYVSVEEADGSAAANLTAVSLARIVRLMRILRSMRSYRAVFSTLSKMTPVLAGLLSTMALVLYVFAMVGQDLYAGKLRRDDPVLAETDYGKLNYYPLNFDNLWSSYVTLFSMMLVNQWHAVRTGFEVAQVSRHSSSAENSGVAWTFFGFYYVIAVLLVVNVAVAFMLQVFNHYFDSAAHGAAAASALADAGAPAPTSPRTTRLANEDDSEDEEEDEGTLLPEVEPAMGLQLPGAGDVSEAVRTRSNMRVEKINALSQEMVADLQDFCSEYFHAPVTVKLNLDLTHFLIECFGEGGGEDDDEALDQKEPLWGDLIERAERQAQYADAGRWVRQSMVSIAPRSWQDRLCCRTPTLKAVDRDAAAAIGTRSRSSSVELVLASRPRFTTRRASLAAAGTAVQFAVRAGNAGTLAALPEASMSKSTERSSDAGSGADSDAECTQNVLANPPAPPARPPAPPAAPPQSYSVAADAD